MPSSVLFGSPTTCRPFDIVPIRFFAIPPLHIRGGECRFSPVCTSSLYYMNSSLRHRHVLKFSSLANPRMLISVRVTTSSYGTIVFRCSITIPITTLSTLRRSTLPCLTQDSLLMLRLTAYQVDVSCPLYEAPLAGRTTRYQCFISKKTSKNTFLNLSPMYVNICYAIGLRKIVILRKSLQF